MKYLSDRIFTNILPIYNNRYFSKSDTKCNHKRHLEIAVSYPNASDEINEQNRSLVHKILATCLGVSNLWVLKKKCEDLNSIESAEESAQYPDYDYQGNKQDILKTLFTVMRVFTSVPPAVEFVGKRCIPLTTVRAD